MLRKVYDDLTALIKEAKNKEICTSLAVFKPAKIIDFNAIPVEREWDKKKIAELKAKREQGNLFEHPEDPFDVVDKLPYKFVYTVMDIMSLRTTG